MEIKLTDKVVLVTGASEGIGAAIAADAAKCGARVALLSRDREQLDQVADKIGREGGEALVVVADVADEQEMQQAIEKVVTTWGRLDVLVANAGTNGTWSPIDEFSLEDWQQTLDVNLTGTFLAVRYSVPHMKKIGGGSIVFISSVNGTRVFSNEGASAYATSKAGQLALGQMLALELGPFHIRVNVVCPGAIDTGIHEKTERHDLEKVEIPVEFPEGNIPLTGGRMGTPQQVAQLVTFLASDAASHITGTPIWIDGAESLIMG